MPSTPDQNRPCVLVVEPDAITRDLLQIALERAGFETKSAQTGERALLVLREDRAGVDWLVTRQVLPGLVDGPMLADEFHTHHPSHPVLIGPGATRCEPASEPGSYRAINLSDPLSPGEVVGQLRELTNSLGQPRCIDEKQALAA
jgi:DNA-binding NtrC family response regulator